MLLQSWKSYRNIGKIAFFKGSQNQFRILMVAIIFSMTVWWVIKKIEPKCEVYLILIMYLSIWFVPKKVKYMYIFKARNLCCLWGNFSLSNQIWWKFRCVHQISLKSTFKTSFSVHNNYSHENEGVLLCRNIRAGFFFSLFEDLNEIN